MAQKAVQYEFETEHYSVEAGFVRSFGLYGGSALSQEMGAHDGHRTEKASSETPLYSESKGRWGLKIEVGLVAESISDGRYKATVSAKLDGDRESVERMATLLDQAFSGKSPLRHQ